MQLYLTLLLRYAKNPKINLKYDIYSFIFLRILVITRKIMDYYINISLKKRI